MVKKAKLDRDTIVKVLVKALEPLDYTYAFYEGGAAAWNRIDDWSDIDLYLVVNDDKVDDAFLATEEALKSLSPIARASSKEKFLEPEIHGNNVIFFNKNNRIKPPPLDKANFFSKLYQRLERLQARFDMFNIFIQKEINRGNHIEATCLYHDLTIPLLVEALRIKHNPIHYEFKMRYVHYELPPETVKKLRQLSFVKDGKDLQKKYDQTSRWFIKTMREIDKKEIERLAEKSNPC